MANDTIIPAMAPPAGQTSNFVDPPYTGTKFLVVNCVFLPLAFIALGVRTWTRAFVVRSFRWDDCESELIPQTGLITDPHRRFNGYGSCMQLYLPNVKLTDCLLMQIDSSQILSCALTGVTLESKLI